MTNLPTAPPARNAKFHRRPIRSQLRPRGEKLAAESWTPEQVSRLWAALHRVILHGDIPAASFFARSLAHYFKDQATRNAGGGI